jgi:glyceraldehyde-3-phosphate dehydrogenase/erythrose-4-phosphate dehydrogenase
MAQKKTTDGAQAKGGRKLPTGEGLSVLVIGTGAVAIPTAMLLRVAMPHAELFIAKRAWRNENIGRMLRLYEQYGVKLAVQGEVIERFREASFHGFSYPEAITVEEAARKVNCIVDCTGLDIKAWYEDLLAERHRDDLRGIAAEGGIGEFGPQLMYGINDTVIDLTLERRVEIPSCNTHAITALLWGLTDCGKDIDRFHQAIVYIDRRNQDKGKEGGAIQTPTYEALIDEDCGTHQARDSYDIIVTALGGRVPPNLRIVSHAVKVPQPFMHADYFAITAEGKWTKEMVHERLERCPLLAFTDYKSMGQVYDEFCTFSFASRGYDYAVVLEGQTQIVPWSGIGVMQNPDAPDMSTIMLSTVVPQEGNAVLSNLACALKFLYPEEYTAMIEEVIASQHLLTAIV